jgi:hypothetical protein
LVSRYVLRLLCHQVTKANVSGSYWRTLMICNLAVK